MKVTLNWLKQYVNFNWSVEETVERLMITSPGNPNGCARPYLAEIAFVG